MKYGGIKQTLLASAGLLGLLGFGSVAFAQTSAAAPNALEEVVVTATKTQSTVNRVPMSVSAVTEKTIEAQGIKSVDDISRTVPGMTFRTSSSEGNPAITLRGIGGFAALVGSATTGIYLDDTSLTQRNLNGARTGNGSPFPQLFDLDRVEVLRGPQGTLYGGSSEGGTVRFITPTPSLNAYSAHVRTEASVTAHGAPSYEVGAAVGGPIVEDKLGFRISLVDRRDGGFIDAKSVYDGQTFAEDVNYRDARAFRGSLRWEVAPSFTITPALYVSYDRLNNPDTFWLPTPKQTYAGSTIYNGAPAPQLGAAFAAGACSSTGSPTPAAGPCRTTINGVSYFWAFPNTSIAPYTQAATPWFSGYSMGNGRYLTTTSQPVFVASPRTTTLFLPSLTLEKAFDFMTVKSITSYVENTTKGWAYQGGQGSSTFRYISRFMLGATPCDPANVNSQPRGTDGRPAATGQCYQNGLYAPGVPDWEDYFYFRQQRKETTEELRFSSNNPEARLTWVGGLYFSDSDLHVHGQEETNDNIYTQRLRGAPIAWFAGAYGLPENADPRLPLSPPARISDISDRENWVHEREWALFGEANFSVTSKLKLTAGLRLADYKQNYRQVYGGYQAGSPPAGTNPLVPQGWVPSAAALQAASRDPTKPNSATNPIVNPNTLAPFPVDLGGCPTSAGCPLQYTDLEDHEKTVAPKIGLSYQLSETNLIYATYAKGFRPGGVNPPLPPITCAAALTQLGLTASPLNFAQDSVNSYEIGSKMRILDGRVQLNTAAFMIDWVDMQYTLSGFPAPCGFQLIVNASRARSAGAELQAIGQFGPLSLGANIGYDSATFTSDVKNAAGVIYAKQGDNLGSPDWTVTLNGQYNFSLADQPGFLRVDYSYTGKYMRGPGPGTTTYDAYTTWADPLEVWNARLGITYRHIDWSLFALNLTDTHTFTNLGGGTTTSADPALATASSIRPRTIGLQANYRF